MSTPTVTRWPDRQAWAWIRKRVEFCPDTEGCWRWRSPHLTCGFEGKTWRPNRYLWLQKHGSVPARLSRRCDDERCVNPEHWSEVPPRRAQSAGHVRNRIRGKRAAADARGHLVTRRIVAAVHRHLAEAGKSLNEFAGEIGVPAMSLYWICHPDEDRRTGWSRYVPVIDAALR